MTEKDLAILEDIGGATWRIVEVTEKLCQLQYDYSQLINESLDPSGEGIGEILKSYAKDLGQLQIKAAQGQESLEGISEAIRDVTRVETAAEKAVRKHGEEIYNLTAVNKSLNAQMLTLEKKLKDEVDELIKNDKWTDENAESTRLLASQIKELQKQLVANEKKLKIETKALNERAKALERINNPYGDAFESIKKAATDNSEYFTKIPDIKHMVRHFPGKIDILIFLYEGPIPGFHDVELKMIDFPEIVFNYPLFCDGKNSSIFTIFRCRF